MVVLGNAFSLGMLLEGETNLKVKEVDLKEVKELIKDGFMSIIGHESTAKFLSLLLGVEIPLNRVNWKIKKEDQLVVFQLLGRLPEGVVLTEEHLVNYKYKFYLVKIV